MPSYYPFPSIASLSLSMLQNHDFSEALQVAEDARLEGSES